jgi:S-DNA-T family DNA segregation ATPase FtsK/SpoIIIE
MEMRAYMGGGGQQYRIGGWRDFLRRRMAEILGAALFVMGLALGLALLTAHESDPSFSRAAEGATMNIIGPAGAHFADFALQGLGLAAVLLVLAPLCWGWKLMRDRGLEQWWLRLALLPPALVLGAGALAGLGQGGSWPWNLGYGGFVGRLLLSGVDGAGGLTGVAQMLGAPSVMGRAEFLPAATLAALAAILAFLTLGISIKGYLLFARHVAGAGKSAGAALEGALSGMPGFKDRLSRLNERRDVAQTMGRDQPRFDNDPPPALDDETVRSKLAEHVIPAILRRSAKPGAQVERARARPAKRNPARQASLDFEGEERFELPPIDLLAQPIVNAAAQRINEESLEKNARLLETVLEDFGVKGEITRVRPGPVVTLYELEPAPGTKTSRVVSLADDVARSMSAVSVRIAVVPGRSVIGIELPNRERETVALRELLEDEAYRSSPARLALTLGKDIGGQPIVVDLARMPHLLIAGTTGSGKSVAINTMIMSLLYRLTPEQCKFIMIDPKMLELSVYDGIPHLLSPVVTEPKKAVVALKWVVREMENRYRSMSRLGVRNIEGFNQRLEHARKAGERLTRKVQTGFDPDSGQPIYEEEPFDLKPLPLIVVVVDEMADLMLVAGKDIEAAIQRLAQMARAAGIHIIMATQRPSVDVITGTIKANFPTRVSFHVTTKIDSRTILSETGAEQLLGQGDMLYMANGGRITRVHGPFISDREVEAIVQHLKAQGEPTYLQEVTLDDESETQDAGGGEIEGGGDDLYDQAVMLVTRERKASTSFVQRHLQIGYNRAARIIERMEKEGVVGSANHVGKREVLARGLDSMD